MPYGLDVIEHGEDAAGIRRSDLANAISTWHAMQDGSSKGVPVTSAMMAFNATAELVEYAVEDHYWMTIRKDGERPDQWFIEQDGE